MVNHWQPASAQKDHQEVLLDKNLLLKLARHSEQLTIHSGSATADGGSTLSEQEEQLARQYIQIAEQEWLHFLSEMPCESLIPLARFYTLAEGTLSGFQAGASNPAIWIFRYLKAHDLLPEKSVISALKAATDNRFIPYGSVF